MSGGQTYWGALPPPAVVAQRQSSLRRNSYNSDRKATLPPDAELSGLHESPYPAEAQPQSRPNRMSQQSNTTQSSQNSWASPKDEQFGQRGLQPRPGSWQQGPPQGQSGPYNPEAEERRRRRASRQQAEEHAEYEGAGGVAYDGGATSSGPIKSNRNGHAPNRQSSHRQSTSQPEDLYRNNGYQPQHGPLNVNTNLGRANTTGRISSQQQAANDAERGIRRGSVTARKEKPEIRSAVEDMRQRGSNRRVSEVSQEGFTSDKSPLQALETDFAKLKEEKRARAQEAERQLRERQASGASTAIRGTQNTVRFDGSSEQAPRTVSQRAVVEDVGQDISPKTSAHIQDRSERKLSSLSQPLEERPSTKKLTKERATTTQQTWADLNAQVHGPAPRAKVLTVIEPGVQRNASFRQRAGQSLGPEIILGTTTAISRRDSNKLKKNPPSDPWRLAREDREMQAEEFAKARRAEREQQSRLASGGPLGSSPIDPPNQQALPSSKSHANTKKQREALYVAAQPIHPDVDEDDLAGMQSVKRSNSARKVEQVLGAEVAFNKPKPDILRAISPAEQQLYAGRLDRSGELGPDGQGDIYGITRANRRGKDGQISALTGDGASDHGDHHARGADGRHHFSNIIRGGREMVGRHEQSVRNTFARWLRAERKQKKV